MAQHRCDTDNPTRPCCWAARKAELDEMRKADEARRAKYGSSRCPKCHEVYRVTDGVVEDHERVCTGVLSDEQIWR
jgi:formylmethanofuran dehydrogenase subunit E